VVHHSKTDFILFLCWNPNILLLLPDNLDTTKWEDQTPAVLDGYKRKADASNYQSKFNLHTNTNII